MIKCNYKLQNNTQTLFTTCFNEMSMMLLFAIHIHQLISRPSKTNIYSAVCRKRIRG